MKNIYPYLLQGSTFQEFSVNILNSFMGSRSTLVNNPGKKWQFLSHLISSFKQENALDKI